MSAVFTPRETVSELDRFIIGQRDAKRAVALALRSRWRRQQVEQPMRDEIAPRNIIMIGPTGVGKTEIARRLAKLSGAPFLKVEASKFTEVGYVGRDVESMIRDLVEQSMNLVRTEEHARVEVVAEQRTEERLLDALMGEGQRQRPTSYFAVSPDGTTSPSEGGEEREALRKKLRAGELEERELTVQVTEGPKLPFEMVSAPGMEDFANQLRDAMGQLGGRSKEKSLSVEAARKLFIDEESEKLLDPDQLKTMAIERAQESGMIFLDEIDKIAAPEGRGGGRSADVSRGGVQRDLLPIVEGAAVTTKYGVVNTDHILFIAAGAFHETKVSDLIPELQGRFPIRVELQALSEDDFYRILTEPANSLTRQYDALLKTEDVSLSWREDGLRSLAKYAATANERLENIGARRLHTILEALLEEISFHAPERRGEALVIDAALVEERLSAILEDEDLSRYIL